MEVHDHIWNHHEKYIEISTNMPGIGSVICELAIEIWEIGESKPLLLLHAGDGQFIAL